MKKKKKIPPVNAVASNTESVANESPITQTTSESDSNTQPSAMEVHHHAHIHSKSKWKEYIFQFFMLFLAVFCGFLAEYQLEHKIERDRELVYMQSMIEDLAADTVEINSVFQRLDTVHFPACNKGLPLLYGRDTSDSIVALMYEIVPKCISFLEVRFEDRTKTQLTNSGNLRLIRCKAVTDSLARYWRICDNVGHPLLTAYAETRSRAKWAMIELFDFVNYVDYSPNRPLLEGITPRLIDYDLGKRIALANLISNLRAQSTGPLSRTLLATKDKSTRLIELIKKEYHME